MSWPVAAVIIALMLCITSVLRAALFARIDDEVADELDQVWNAIDLTVRDVERITPVEMSLSDQ